MYTVSGPSSGERIENAPLTIPISTEQSNSMLVLGSSGENMHCFRAFLSKYLKERFVGYSIILSFDNEILICNKKDWIKYLKGKFLAI